MAFENVNATIGRTGGWLASWRPVAGESAGRFEGAPYGSDVSFLVVDGGHGDGPVVHSHPYSETFIVQRGRVVFEIESRSIDAGPGDVIVVEPGTPHSFRAIGPQRLQLVAVHAAPRIETTWLDGDREPERTAA